MALDPKVKAEWVRVLRENKAKQCFGELFKGWEHGQKMCAIGAGLEALTRLGHLKAGEKYEYSTYSAVAKLGLSEKEGERIFYCMNDRSHQPFDVIAAHIEQNL